MNSTRPRKRIVLLACMLAASIALNVVLYPAATRPLVSEGDQPLIERTIAMYAARGGREEELRHHFFPIVTRLTNRDCVELRSRHERGRVGACYDRRSGAIVEESESVADGATSLREMLEGWTISLIGWP
jgi:hypothetical protein